MTQSVQAPRRRLAASDTPLAPLEDALNRAGDGVCVVGPDGRIMLWNRAAEKMLGHAGRDLVGRSCCDVFAGRDDDGNRLCYQGCQVTTWIAMGEPIQSFDMKTRTKAGQPVWLNISILAVPLAGNGNGGGPAGTVTLHFFRDVTAKKDLLTVLEERAAARADRDSGVDPAQALSRRELEVLRLLAAGLNTRTAAERLHVSPATVRNHVQNLFAKLEVHSRLEAVAYASKHRLL
jgi:PAS domain S-box-containing protein